MLIPISIRRYTIVALLAILPLLATASQTQNQAPLSLLERSIEPGEKREFPFMLEDSFDAAFVNMPVYAIRGRESGHRLCVTAGIHGDEINGSVIAQRAFKKIDPDILRGTVIMLPMINSAGIRNSERYMPDRRDLNRNFPGNYDGSIAAIVARATFDVITTHCDSLIDLHTASFLRTNAPQIRVTSNNPEALTLARNFGSGIIIFGEGPKGSLRREATDAGVPAIIYEAAGPHILDVKATDIGVHGIMNVMRHLEMLPGDSPDIPDHKVYQHTAWERVPLRSGGFFFPDIELDARVRVGQRLGHLVSPLNNKTTVIYAKNNGIVIGMAKPQVVLSGYALFHLGFDSQDFNPLENEQTDKESTDKEHKDKKLLEKESMNEQSDG